MNLGRESAYRLGTLPLTALRGFYFVGRYGSIKAAAKSLCVTPSAVSHQLRQLENALGMSLLKRTPNGVVLTEPGIKFWKNLEVAFETLMRGIAEAKGERPWKDCNAQAPICYGGVREANDVHVL